jgi:uncharacterized membrane protein YccF (DUF307 family)
MSVLQTIGNVIWLILAGWWLALGYALAGLVMFVLIITIPFGIQAFKMAGFVIWPYGRTVVDDPDADDRRGLSAVGNVLWILLAGWELALAHIVAGLVMFITIIGIPFGVASFKMVPLALLPFGRTVVTLEQAEQNNQTALVTVSQ